MAPSVPHRRFHERTKVELDGAVGDINESVTCQVVEFGQGGVRVRNGGSFDVADAVELVIPGLGKFQGVVAWKDSNMMGIEFRAPNFEAATLTKLPEAGLDPF